MDVNKEIKQYLTKRREEAMADFLKTENPHPLFVEIFAALGAINQAAVQQAFLDELKENCQAHWTDVEQGFNPDEKVRVLLFEYDYFLSVDPEAMAYGIVGADFKIKTSPYKFGYNYDFVSSIEANNGITLTTLSPLSKLGDDTPPEYQDVDFYEEAGFIALRDSYLYTTYLILHEAIKDFVRSEEFKLLSREEILHFMIGEHDCGNEQPIYYDCADAKLMDQAIEAQGESIHNDDLSDLLDFKRKIDDLIDNENEEDTDEILKGLNLLLDKESTKSWAAYKLGNLYMEGFGVEKDINKAVGYMELAAAHGNYMAKVNLASCYYTGTGQPRDLNKALALLIEADNYYLLKGEYTKIIEKIKKEIEQSN